VRTVLITGAGGAGRTTVAAVTAAATAARGSRVLLLSADRNPCLDTILGLPLGAEPARAAPDLWASRIDAVASFRADAQRLQEHLGSLLDLLATGPLDTEELTELPGADALALLRALRDAAAGTWDVVVVDLPSSYAALTALALPEQLRRYLRRLVPAERRAARALRPMLAQLAGMPMPAQWAYEAASRADLELAAAQAVVEDAGTTVRLVLEPGPSAAEALRSARTGLALFGHRLEAVIANRVLPTASTDPFLAGLSGAQQKQLKELHAEFGAASIAVRELPHLGREPLGADDLAALAAVAADGADGVAIPAAPAPDAGLSGPGRTGGGLSVEPAPRTGPAAAPWTVEDRLAAEGHLLWRLPLPGATREGLDLVRLGEELVIDVDGFRRILPLPSALRRCTVAGAALRGGELWVRFEPDPELWPINAVPLFR
jgi:arsenite-transporting ATPase